MLDDHGTKRAPARGHYDRSATVSERVNKQRELIFECIRRELVHSLPSSITVTRLTNMTGLGRNTLYGHFPSVEAGCQSVISQCWTELRQHLAQRPVTSATPISLCQELSERWFDSVVAAAESTQVLIHCNSEQFSALLFDELEDLWEVGARAGAFAPGQDPIRLRALAAALSELIGAVARADASSNHCASVMTDLLSRGLR